MKTTDHNSPYLLSVGILAAVLTLPCGCGAINAGTLYSGDAQKVAEAIEELNDTKTNKRFAAAFVKGAVPTDQKKYRSFDYGVAGKPMVKGAAATAEVVLTKNSDRVGTKQWELEKEGDTWKIKSAPLP